MQNPSKDCHTLDYNSTESFSLGLESYKEGNYNCAVENFRTGALQNHAASQYYLAKCLSKGKGVKTNEDSAFFWFTKAAKQGHSGAQYHLGKYLCHKYRWTDPKRVSQAFKWSFLAAQQGHIKASLDVGKYYERGCGVKRNMKLALEWYSRWAHQGAAVAQFKLGDFYIHVEKNQRSGIHWITMSAVQGYEPAQFYLGQHYFNTGNQEESFHWLIKSASQGNQNAQFSIAEYFRLGAGVRKSNNEAIKWYFRADKRGNYLAHSRLTDLLSKTRWSLDMHKYFLEKERNGIKMLIVLAHKGYLGCVTMDVLKIICEYVVQQ